MSEKMPVLFVGHGSPMNAIENNEFSQAWETMGKSLPTPKAILAVSAHWETNGTKVTAVDRPKTIYDFYGFPQELYAVTYPAPGSPALVDTVRRIVKMTEVEGDTGWGLDHGTWSVLKRMFPEANVPVVQFSLDRTKNPLYHYQLGQQLKELREDGVLIVSSGNIVHNLRAVIWDDAAKYDWAEAFDAKVKQWILDGDHAPLINFEQHGREAALAINSGEHYLPLLYTLGAKDEAEPVTFFADKVTYGSLSMRSVKVG
jgi:4,5-DOPA dioxygenase extradiol